MRLFLSSLCAALIALTSCNSPTEACTLSMEPGIEIQIFDAATGEVIYSPRITVWEGADTLSVASLGAEVDAFYNRYVTAHERVGTYSIRVRKDGYKDWVKSGVRVRSGDCHVKTVTVKVRMTPE